MVAARRALDDLYRSHAAEVYRYAYAVLGNHADAEDVTQTTFVNALRALERGERPRKPSNWLITITHNIVRQRFRQQQSRPTEVELVREVAQEPEESNGPSMEELVRALQRIPQSQREALVLRELEGRSYDEIAQTLNLTKGALETLLFRARRSLADELENAATCDRAELEPLPAARRPNFSQGAQAAPRSHRRVPGLRAPPGDPGQAAARVQGPCPPPPPLRAHVLQGRTERFGGNGAAHDRCGRVRGGRRRRNRNRRWAYRSAASRLEASLSRRPPSSRPPRSRVASASSALEKSTTTIRPQNRSLPKSARARPGTSLGATVGSRTQAQTRHAARVQRAGLASASAKRANATHGLSTPHGQKHTGTGQSASAPGHVKAPKDVVKIKPAHPTPGSHAPATASDNTTRPPSSRTRLHRRSRRRTARGRLTRPRSPGQPRPNRRFRPHRGRKDPGHRRRRPPPRRLPHPWAGNRTAPRPPATAPAPKGNGKDS